MTALSGAERAIAPTAEGPVLRTPSVQADPPSGGPLSIGTADRSFGAELTGALARGSISPPPSGPLRFALRGTPVRASAHSWVPGSS